MINGVRRAQAGQFAGSAVMSRKVMMKIINVMDVINIINIINMINDKWGPPGPGKAVWGLCRDHSGKLRMVDCLYGANPAPKRGPLGSEGGQCANSAGRNDERNEQ